MTIKREIILVDIDRTISETNWRENAEDFDEYHAELVHDLPALDTLRVIDFLNHRNHEVSILGFGSRPEKWRAITNAWMLKHAVQLDNLLLRADDDFTPATDCKVAMVKDFLGEDFANHVLLAIVENDAVCAAFKALGVTVFQVHNRRY